MEAVIDGVVYQYQHRGGISRIYNEILPRMCDYDPSLHISLFTTGRCLQPLPIHANIRHNHLFRVDDFLRPQRLWWPTLQLARGAIGRQWADALATSIWHSTYYSRPLRWQGPVVVTVLDMIHELFPRLFPGNINDQFRAQKRRCIRGADVVICISETTRQDAVQIYGIEPAKTVVIPLAHSAVFRRVHTESDSFPPHTDGPFLLYVGARAGYKNADMLLNAYARWSQREQVYLLFVGPPWSASERQRLVELQIKDRVRLIDDADDETLCQLYNRAVTFVYPSLYEGFGIPLLEAMACGCPIVASRIPSSAEIAGGRAIYFEPTQTDDLLAALDTVTVKGVTSALSESGLQHAQRYSWNDTARKTLDVYALLSH